MEIKNVTFIGLGVMGYNMAGHLKKNNYNTTVYNRTTSVADKWVKEFSGKAKSTPGQAVSDAQVVFICVGRDEDLVSVMEGNDGIIKNVKENTIIVFSLILFIIPSLPSITDTKSSSLPTHIKTIWASDDASPGVNFANPENSLTHLSATELVLL